MPPYRWVSIICNASEAPCIFKTTTLRLSQNSIFTHHSHGQVNIIDWVEVRSWSEWTPWSSHPWSANISSVNKEILRILWNSSVHDSPHNSPPLVPVLDQINTVHALPTHVRCILILSSHLRQYIPGHVCPQKPCMHFSSPPHGPHGPHSSSSLISSAE